MSAAYTCPEGHASTTGDYCDTCGAAIAPQTGQPPAPASPSGDPVAMHCANCGADRTPGDLFCEVCGVDFATGKMPAAPPKPQPASTSTGPVVPAVPTGWTVVVEADRAYFDKNQAEGGATLAFPDQQPTREIPLAKDEVFVGRGGTVDVDLNHVDPAVSHHHLHLTRQPDGDGWELVDDGSANGTWLDDDPDPITPGAPIALRSGSRIHIGAFTTLTLRDDRSSTAP